MTMKILNAATSKSRIWVVVLNWNGKEDTVRCLESLKKAEGDFSIIVVDNGSTDGSPAAIESQFPDVEIMAFPENTGFARGNNEGMKEAMRLGAEKIILLNNDVEVEPNLIQELDRETRHEKIGLAGPLIYLASRRDEIWPSVGRICLWIANHRSAKTLEQVRRLKESEIGFLSGCCLLIKRSVIDRIGLLDERFFAYFEEADYCLRAGKAGFNLTVADGTRIYHKVAASSGGTYSGTYAYLFSRSNFLFARKHLRAWHWPVFILFFSYRRILKDIFRAGLGNTLLGVVDACRGEFGKPRM